MIDLHRHVVTFRDDPDSIGSIPFAPDPAFAPLFKVFHSVAKQGGLHMPEEAFTHHLLSRAAQEAATAIAPTALAEAR